MKHVVEIETIDRIYKKYKFGKCYQQIWYELEYVTLDSKTKLTETKRILFASQAKRDEMVSKLEFLAKSNPIEDQIIVDEVTALAEIGLRNKNLSICKGKDILCSKWK